MKMKSVFEMERCKVFLLLVGILLFSTLSAQNASRIKISGTVVDNVQKETIIGASVAIKGTTNGTITDTDGRFQLEAPSNATLVISFIGFKSKEVAVSGKSELSITLDEDAELLDEIIVIGYGQVKKGDVTGSLTTITPDELNKGKLLTAQDALVGKIAGVSVVPGSGAPGDGGTIRIRMGASLSASNDPLLIIDGIPVVNTNISSINPNDIASFTVLKDASATAIYGSRASNGVVIITTKKGSLTGGKQKVSYSATFSASKTNKYLDVLSGDEYRDAFRKYATSAPATYPLGDADTDWQKQIYRTALGTDHNVSVTGAALNTPYRVSVGYTNQNGTIKENNYERINASIGLSPTFFNKHLSLDINVKGSIENENPVSASSVYGAASFDPTRPVHAEYPGNVGLGYYMWKGVTNAASNPIADIMLTDKMNKTKRSTGGVVADYKIHGFEDLRLNVSLGYDIFKTDYDENVPDLAPSMYVSNRYDGTGKVYSKVSEKKNYLIDLYANYSKEISENHSVSAMGGYGWQRFWNRNNDSEIDTKGVEVTKPTHGEAELYLLSFFGRANYTYAGKLLLTATLRADASSRFAKDNRWGYFPSVALAYRLNEEAFVKNIPSLSDLKLRLSYGQTGQQEIGTYYQHLGTYTMSYDNSRYQFGDKWITLYRPNGYDPLIKWETTTTYNVGIDYGFLNNRIYGSIDAYKRYTDDLLNRIFVPAGSNFTNQIDTNIGDMKSNGIELSLNGTPIKNKDWEWSIGGNFTWNSSKITKLNAIDTQGSQIKTGSAGGTGQELQVHRLNETPHTFFLLKQAYDDNGKPLDGKYIAKDGSITTGEGDVNRYMTGKSSRVPYYYGLSSRVSYKQWDLGINGHGSFGNYIFNFPEASDSFEDLYGNTSGNILRSTLATGFTQKRLYSDHFLESANFFKLDNITLGYSFKKLWNSSSSMRLAFSVHNVFTITPYSGIDPEVYSGIDRNIYQRPRNYSLSLNLNF